jgi:hypothetical protein
MKRIMALALAAAMAGAAHASEDLTLVDTATPCPAGIFDTPSRFSNAQVAYCFLIRLNDDDDPTDAYGLLAPGATLTEPDGLPYRGSYAGVDALNLRFLPAFFGAWQTARSTPIGITQGGDSVAILIEFNATARQSGRLVRTHLIELYRFDNGRITEIWPYYFDTAAVRDVLGVTSEVPAAVRAYYDALMAGDRDRALSALADDAVLVEPNTLPYRGEFVGPDGWRRFFALFGASWASARTDNHGFSVDGDQVWARFDLTVTTHCGMSVSTPVAENLRVTGGRIARMEVFYADTADLAEALAKCRR